MKMEKVINLRFRNNMPIWAFYRSGVLLFEKRTHQKLESLKIKNQKMIKFFNLFKGMRYIFFKRKKIFLFSTTALNFKNNTKYKNILDDYYYEIYPNETQIFESPLEDFSWKTPREKKFSTINTYLEILAIILGKIIPLKSNNQDVKKFFLEIYETNKQITYKKLLEIERRVFWVEKVFELFFRITKPKLILFNCASYGQNLSVIINVAKNLGIKTGEVQHGIVSKGHIVYQLNEIEQLKLKDYFPDYFLTFGRYWNMQVCLPSNNIVIGNPDINSHLKKLNDKKIIKTIDYLIVSQWTLTNKMIEIAIELRKYKKNEKIYFRLHPSEILTKNQIKLLRENNIKICDKKNGIYYFLERSKNIIGCYSTVLIESVIFKNNIYIYDNELSRENIPEGIGQFFKNVKEITDINKYNFVDYDYYWDSNFKENYISFIENIIKI